MELELLRLLQTQRELYTIPRGMERFRAYLATMTGGADDIVLPLVAMNPMGKEHVPAMIDALIAFDAEAVAAEALVEAARRIPPLDVGRLRVGLVAADDAQGGWTNRYFGEMGQRFNSAAMLKRGWVGVPLWTSETWTAERVRREVLAAVYRTAYTVRAGTPETLGQMLAQEGHVALFADLCEGALDAEDLEYSRVVIGLYRESTQTPVQFACLYGDEIARSVGYLPLGLSDHAGFAVARADAIELGISPEAALVTG